MIEEEAQEDEEQRIAEENQVAQFKSQMQALQKSAEEEQARL